MVQPVGIKYYTCNIVARKLYNVHCVSVLCIVLIVCEDNLNKAYSLANVYSNSCIY